MNHIQRLTQDRDEVRAQIKEMRDRIAEFKTHLASPKFSTPATDGSRVDWISTADVARWLNYIGE